MTDIDSAEFRDLDFTERYHAIRESIANKTAKRPKADDRDRPIVPPTDSGDAA